jgi:hypothetical protein
MPFFLVTQTSLIEANDENEAARNAVDQIRSGKQVTVTVKSDETTISHIVIAAKSEDGPAVDIADCEMEWLDQALESSPDTDNTSDKRAILNRIIRDARALLRWRS